MNIKLLPMIIIKNADSDTIYNSFIKLNKKQRDILLIKFISVYHYYNNICLTRDTMGYKHYKGLTKVFYRIQCFYLKMIKELNKITQAELMFKQLGF